MSIELAPDDDAGLTPLAAAEKYHRSTVPDPNVIRQVNELLDDVTTLRAISVNHSSLLVRMLAQRLLVSTEPTPVQPPAPEQIVGVALREYTDRGLVFSQARPADHFGLIRHMSNELGLINGENFEHGFITDRGRFLNRTDAYMLARQNGQYRRTGDAQVRKLYSEDLW